MNPVHGSRGRGIPGSALDGFEDAVTNAAGCTLGQRPQARPLHRWLVVFQVLCKQAPGCRSAPWRRWQSCGGSTATKIYCHTSGATCHPRSAASWTASCLPSNFLWVRSWRHHAVISDVSSRRAIRTAYLRPTSRTERGCLGPIVPRPFPSKPLTRSEDDSDCVSRRACQWQCALLCETVHCLVFMIISRPEITGKAQGNSGTAVCRISGQCHGEPFCQLNKRFPAPLGSRVLGLPRLCLSIVTRR